MLDQHQFFSRSYPIFVRFPTPFHDLQTLSGIDISHLSQILEPLFKNCCISGHKTSHPAVNKQKIQHMSAGDRDSICNLANPMPFARSCTRFDSLGIKRTRRYKCINPASQNILFVNRKISFSLIRVTVSVASRQHTIVVHF